MHTQTAIHFYIYQKFYNAYILHWHKNKQYKAELKKSLVCCHSTLGLQVGLVVQDFFDIGGHSLVPTLVLSHFLVLMHVMSMRRTVIIAYILILYILGRNEAVIW